MEKLGSGQVQILHVAGYTQQVLDSGPTCQKGSTTS